MSARTILNPPLNTTLQELVNENPTFNSVTATVFEGATTISTTPTGVVQCGSAIANSYIQTPSLYVNTIAPVAPSVITTLTSGAMAVSIFGINGNAGIIASNSQQSPFPAGGTQLSFQTFTNASTAVSALGLTTTTINVGLPIVPSYVYPIANTTAIGYSSYSYVAQTPTLTANTWTLITSITIPDNGLWLITAQSLIPTGGNIMSVNTAGTLISNPYCAVASSGGSTQCSNVFNLTAGNVVSLILTSGSGSVATGVYLVYTRIA